MARRAIGLARLVFLGAALAVPVVQAAEPPAETPAAPKGEGDSPPVLPPPPPTEVVVQGATSRAVRTRRSAEAVDLVTTEKYQNRSLDVGDVLARTTGISVRRSAGLGSDSRLTLNGLQGEQIRLFVNGVPLDMAGFTQGIANVPLDLVRGIEVYRGVVPIRFGTDALGGAINLVTEPDQYRTGFRVSGLVGSFHTQRASVGATWAGPDGVVLVADAYVDHAGNDYRVDVEVPDATGRPQPERVRRFHDGYRASGFSLEGGVVDRPYADRLLLRVHSGHVDKELQSDLAMMRPFGEASSQRSSSGVILRYEKGKLLGGRLTLRALGAASRLGSDFTDVSRFVYNWFGRPIFESPTRGETGSRPYDDSYQEVAWYGRGSAEAILAPPSTVRVVVTPSHRSRKGTNHLTPPGVADALAGDRALTLVVTGLEHELALFERTIQNLTFVKDYRFHASIEETLSTGVARRLDQDHSRFGAGDAFRWNLTPRLAVKVSYEYATRFATRDEIFGDGVFVVPNLVLKPEVSHNANLQLLASTKETAAGRFTGSLLGTLRLTNDQIVLLQNGFTAKHSNVADTRALGLGVDGRWTSPHSYLTLDGNVTYQDERNQTTGEGFGAFHGDRIPNRPYLLSNATATTTFAEVLSPTDTLRAGVDFRLVGEFFRTWESVGRADSKAKVPNQAVFGLFASYTLGSAPRFTSSYEVTNVLDTRVYDEFGAQRPGRAFFVKLRIDTEP